jgi:hypothetical protein
MDSFRDRAMRVINGTFGGEHHVSSLKWFEGPDHCTFLVGPHLSTYDFAEMSQLVVHCHDECVRGLVSNGGPHRLKITLPHRDRKNRHPDAYAHPALEQHVEQIRRGGSYQPLFDQLRAVDEPTRKEAP